MPLARRASWKDTYGVIDFLKLLTPNTPAMTSSTSAAITWRFIAFRAPGSDAPDASGRRTPGPTPAAPHPARPSSDSRGTPRRRHLGGFEPPGHAQHPDPQRQHPGEQPREPEQEREERHADPRVHVDLAGRVDERIRMQRKEDTRHDEEQERHRHERD